MKLIKKIFMILVVVINVLLLCNKTFATNIGENKTLERGPLGYYCVQKWDGSKWIYLTYNTTFYSDTNGKKYVAYCLCPGLPGVGYVSGEKEGYNVNVKEIIKDERVWRIIKNGYPYKTIQELNVETIDDAYFATMQSINCVLRGYTLEQAKKLYSVGQFAINGENYTDVKRRGEKTLNAMFSLIDIGINGKETRNTLLGVSVEKTTDLIKENDEFYSQSFKIKSNSDISKYSIEKMENITQGAYIADQNCNKKTEFLGNEVFKVMIPKNEISKNIDGTITIKASQKNYPIYYGTSEVQGFQDYALCSEEYETIYTTCKLNVVANKSKICIKKIDSETKAPLKNVKFQIIDESNQVKECVTDENGMIEISDLFPGKYVIKEVETLNNYRLFSDELNVSIGFNETKEIEVKNELKKGNIKVIKVDYDNNEIRLKDVKFQLKNDEGQIIDEKYTDENGELIFENVLEGQYSIIEVETQQDYMLQEDHTTIEVKDNKTSETVIKNKKIKIVEIPVEIEKIVEVEKTVEVEKIVEVEKPVEVEKVVEVEKEVPMEKIIEVEKIIEKPIEKVVYKELPKTGGIGMSHIDDIFIFLSYIFYKIIKIKNII